MRRISLRSSKSKKPTKGRSRPKADGPLARVFGGKRSSKKKKGYLPIVFVVLFILGVTAAWSSRKVYTQARTIKEHGIYLKDGLLLQDFPQIRRAVVLLKEDVSNTKKATLPVMWARAIPLLGGYVSDLSHGLDAAEHGLKALDIALDELEPTAANLGFKTEQQEIAASGQDRLIGVIKAMPVLSQSTDEIGAELSIVRREIDKINPKRYPKFIAGDIQSTLTQIQTAIDEIDTAMPDIRELLVTFPGVAGDPDKKTYLILFQNDKEIRPTGGFWTAYALATVEKGQIVGMASGDMYFLDIDNRVPFYPPAPEVVQKYLKIDEWYIRDTNLSPDYVESVKTMEEFWARVPGVPGIDGVMAVDTQFVEGLLGVIGEIKLPGYEEPFTKDNVVQQLELVANVLGSKLEKRQGRKDILGQLMQQMLAKMFSMPAGNYQELIAEVYRMGVEKHILLYFHSPKAQELAEEYNFAGRIQDYDGDYLHVNDSNFGGRKANWFMEEVVTKELKEDGGKWISTVTIDYENTGDYDAEWNTGYRDYVRVYVPKGSRLISGEGSLEPVGTIEDLGKTAFTAFMAVDPKKTAQLRLVYELPGGVATGKEYRLLVQKQPGTDRFKYVIKAGKKTEEFELVKDREVELRI